MARKTVRKNPYLPLTSQQLAALRSYRDQHGLHWKADLLTAWADAGGDALAGEFSVLKPMRSWYGKKWLSSFDPT